MPLPKITVDTMMSHPEGVCSEYTRALIQSFFSAEEFTAIEILTTNVPRPDGSQVPLQDRLYHILRPEVMPQSAIDQFDAWVVQRFGEIAASTTAGNNCKLQWSGLDTPFKRAVILSELFVHEGLADEVRTHLAEVLNGV